MLAILARNWWVFLLRGVAAIIFGILAIIWPLLTLQVLILLFGAYALVDGVFTVIAGIAAHERNQRWWVLLLQGIAGIIVGVITFFWPGLTALVLLYFIAAWEIITGVMEIIAAIQLRRIIENEWLMIITGIASILFGFILYIFPGRRRAQSGMADRCLLHRLRPSTHIPFTSSARPARATGDDRRISCSPFLN
jgi:uncharacterized membrane protein HdeD (DUF308 family)